MLIRLPGGRWCGGRTPSPQDPSKDTSWPRAAPPKTHRRISFAKISEPLEVPQLLSLQTDSFDWLVGNDDWEAEVAAPSRAPARTSPSKSGLQEIFEEISPIEDFSETMSLSFENPVFYDPKYTVDECKEKDFTYSAPLYVSAEFTNNETGEIKGQTVFMGDFPLMTAQGHLHHQRHRACRRLPAGPLARASTSSAPPTRPPTRTSSPRS